ncbi:hypothetical protein Sste5346_002006 [Sporothrix stenoceras]|uniref:Traf-like signal protein n=1 Tax=Sporothrix stenoceras TaxID=5173 RepID=A0ABR3ZLP9_9PEZI
MPPPNTPEEFFADEYRSAVNSAGRSRSRRFPPHHLPPHNEDSAESDEAGGGDLDLGSHPNTSQSESRRNSIERRMSTGRRSRGSDGDSVAERADIRQLIDQSGISLSSPSPSTISPGNHAERRRLDGAQLMALSNEAQRGWDNDAMAAVQNDYQALLETIRPMVGDIEAETGAATGIPWPLPEEGEAGESSTVAARAPQIGTGNGNGNGVSPLDGQALAIRQRRQQQQEQEKKRSRIPKLDWHALEYIGTYDENLDCPICRAPLVKPQITTCFHIFCAKCLAQSLRHSNRCPIDRNPIQNFSSRTGSVPARPAPHIISNQLDNLHVRCPNRRCDHTSARAFIKEHYKNECPFTKIPCPDPNCEKPVTRRDSEEGRCLHKAIDCVYCGKPVELAALEDHYDTDCNQKELMCEHCLGAFPRQCHNTHVMGCGERRIECKFRTSGCSFTTKKKDFGDHERTCLYGMIMRMNRAHRADMDSMATVLQDSQDRVRKLEAEMAARPAQAPAPVPNPQSATAAAATTTTATAQPSAPQFYEYPSQHPNLQGRVYNQTQPALDAHQDLSSYYDMAAAGDNLAQGNSGGSSGTQPDTPPNGGALVSAGSAPSGPSGTGALAPDDANSDDRMNRIVAYIDIFDAKVENLERYLGEVDARQAQMFMNELGPLKEQILEMRNTMGHISMYVRWLMESFRQTTKRSVGLPSGGAGDEGGSGPTAPPSAPPGASSAASSAGPSATASRSPPTVLRGPTGGMAMPTRRMSDRENPPRL